MPGIFYTNTVHEECAWGIMRHSNRLNFYPIAMPGGYCGRICNGIFNPGEHASNERFDVAIDGEFSNREAIWKAFGDDCDSGIPTGDQHLVAHLLMRDVPLCEILRRAEGQFFVMAHDRVETKLRFGSDRFGLRPHYWTKSGPNFVLGPEVKFCLAQPWVRAEFDPLSLAEYFNFQCVMEERTLFMGIEVFPAGSIGCFDIAGEHWIVEPYVRWSDLCTTPFKGSFEDAVEETSFLFRRAVHGAAKGRCGIYLSGGLDSRQILAAMPETKGLPTFCFGPSGSPDMVYARQCAHIAGTDHHEFPMDDGRWLQQIAEQHTRLAEGFHCLWHAHNLWRAAEAGEHMKVNLHGHFGDLLLGGSYVAPKPLANVMDGLMETFQCRWGGMFESPDEYASHIGAVESSIAGDVRCAFARCFEGFTDLPRAMASDLFALHYHGRKQIQYYFIHNRPWFEAKCPFLELPLLRHLYSLPDEFRAERRLQVAVLKRYDRNLSRVPWAKTQFPPSGVPTDVLYHKVRRFLDRSGIGALLRKHPYTPTQPIFNDFYSTWSSRELQPWIAATLSNACCVHELQPAGKCVQEMLRGNTAHGKYSRRQTWLLGCSLSLEILGRQVRAFRAC